MLAGTVPPRNRALTGAHGVTRMDTFDRFIFHSTVLGALAALATFAGVVS